MKTKLLLVIVASVIILLGCASARGGRGFFEPEIVSGNERYVTLWDNIGIPGKVEKAANAYCKRFGRFAEYQSKGGDAFECYNKNLCTTYKCVQ